MPAEENFFPFIHTTEDTIDKVDFENMRQFVQVALGYAIELAL